MADKTTTAKTRGRKPATATTQDSAPSAIYALLSAALDAAWRTNRNVTIEAAGVRVTFAPDFEAHIETIEAPMIWQGADALTETANVIYTTASVLRARKGAAL